MYSDALNASLQSALGFGDGPLPFMGQSIVEASMFHHRERHQQDQVDKDQFKDRLVAIFIFCLISKRFIH